MQGDVILDVEDTLSTGIQDDLNRHWANDWREGRERVRVGEGEGMKKRKGGGREREGKKGEGEEKGQEREETNQEFHSVHVCLIFFQVVVVPAPPLR